MTASAIDPTTDASALVRELMLQFLAPPPMLSVTEWAERHRSLSSKDSSEPGPYRVARTPYAREPMDCLSQHSDIDEIVLMWGAQTSKSTIGMNWVGYTIATNPGSMLLGQPTLDLAKKFSRQRIAPMIQESDALRQRVRENRSRDDANTTLLKEYAGGFLVIAGANSAAGLRSMPIRDLFLDEIDAYPHDVDGEGDPIGLAEARQSTFARRKRLKTSTPTVAGRSRIEAAFLESDQRHYYVPCPHCGDHQVLKWGADQPFGLRWRRDDAGLVVPQSVAYVCRHCGAEIAEHAKPTMLAGGEWRPHSLTAAPRRRGYHLSSLYSPLGWLSWATLADEWVKAMRSKSTGDHGPLQVFINTRLAETFKIEGAKTNADVLRQRAKSETYRLRLCPRACLLLTCFVDVQDNRLVATTWGWGRGEESWVIDDRVIYCDPGQWSSWLQLDGYLGSRFPHEGGQRLAIDAVGIDTGGHYTHHVYRYVMLRESRRVHATKGDSVLGKPIVAGTPRKQDVNADGQIIKDGVKLWFIGTDTAKDLLFNRLRIAQPGAGYIHMSPELGDDFFDELTAEERVEQRSARGTESRWVNPGKKRNERTDTAVGNLFLAARLKLHQYTDAEWSRLEQILCPPTADLFSPPVPEPLPAAPPLPGPDAPDASVPEVPLQLLSQPRAAPVRRVRGSL